MARRFGRKRRFKRRRGFKSGRGRRFFRRFFKRRRQMPITQRSRMPGWSEAYRTKLKFHDIRRWGTNDNLPNYQVYQLNCLVTPHVGYTDKPAGFNTLSRMFGRYRVHAAKWKVVFTHLSDVNPLFVGYEVAVSTNVTLTVPPITESAVEDFYSLDKYGGAALLTTAANNAARPRRFKGYTNMRKCFGDRAPDFDNNFQADVTTDPGTKIQLLPWLTDYQFALTSFGCNIYMHVMITFYATFMDRTDPYMTKP